MVRDSPPMASRPCPAALQVVEVRSTPLTLLPDYARQDILRIALSVHDRNILYVLCSEVGLVVLV